VATWEPQDQPARAVVLQCVGYGDSNTFLPMLRANRLAQRGFVVVGKDYAGMGRSDGLHAYVPCFPTLVQVGLID
jgi:alpha-beta hydrolase superfamily lysophospholipase